MSEYLPRDSELLRFERELWGSSVNCIAGVDEAGRGPLAGPVVAAAVVALSPGIVLPPVFDSKQLSDARRRELGNMLFSNPGLKISVAEISAEAIDKINILKATHQAMREALAKFAEIEFALIDGLPVSGLGVPNRSVVKGDCKSALIAAASIVAKVHRDKLMESYAGEYPVYGFERHKGYATAAHISAIERHGLCPIHRRTFEPIKTMLAGNVQTEMEFAREDRLGRGRSPMGVLR